MLTVWDGDYPWDVRVEKICKTLLENGHDAHLLCRNSKALSRTETVNGICVHRIASLPWGHSKLNGIFTFPFFFSPIWRSEIKRVINLIVPEVVIIRDLPIALAVFPVTQPRRIPTVLDMAECYPEMIRCAWKFERFNPLNAIIRNPFFADVVEKITLNKVDVVWVMVEESAQRLARKGFDIRNTRIVSNTPVCRSNVSSIQREHDSPLNILYVGLVNPSRGLRVLVEAARLMRTRFTDFKITIVGSGKDYHHVLKLIRLHGLEQHVFMTGWVQQTDLGPLYDEATVGIVPHFRCSHWDNTIPNKIFDYMNAGVPVVVSDAKPAARIVRETGAGVVYDSFSANDLAEKLILLRDPGLRAELGKNGRVAIRDRYNWSHETSTLLASLEELNTSSRASRSSSERS